MTSKIIDFASLGGPVYAGRPRGELTRKKLKLDEVDKSEVVVSVVIPEGTYSLNSSFFLGMFGPSVIYFKSRDAFLGKYKFDAPSFVLDEVDKGIERALVEVSPL